MATLEQLAEGIRRAHAAGNAEHVRVLGEAYRALQAQSGSGVTQLQGKITPQAARPTEGSENIEDRRIAPPVDLGTATAATISGIVNGIPVLGPLAQGVTDNVLGHVSQAMGGEFDAPVRRREELAARAPVARMAGEIAGGVGALGGLAGVVGKEALGLGGKFLPGVTKAAAANQGLYTADQHARGNAGLDTLALGVPAALGAGGRVAGDALESAGKGLSDAVTHGAQRRLTDAATKGAVQSSGEMKSAASALLEEATGGQPLMISDTAYFRFLGGVKRVADKFRINVDNDQQSVGLLNTLMRIADDTSQGVAVDLKDLHLVRQLASEVAQSSRGRDKAFGTLVIKEMDNLIQTLKPGDILGGADPTQAANQLMRGISGWSRASKVGLIEEAIRKGQAAASGPEKGVRNALRILMKDTDTWKTFSPAEKRAIEDVVNGTAGSNVMKLLGTFGFGGNTATNGIGGAAGMALGASAGGPVGMIAGPVIGSIARKASEEMTGNLARRALAAAGTPNIPVARQAPNLLAPVARPLDLLIRSGGLATY